MKAHQKEVPARSALLVATDDMFATVTPICCAQRRPCVDTWPKGMSRNTIIFHENFQDSLLSTTGSSIWGPIWSALLKIMQIPISCQIRTSSSIWQFIALCPLHLEWIKTSSLCIVERAGEAEEAGERAAAPEKGQRSLWEGPAEKAGNGAMEKAEGASQGKPGGRCWG